MQDYTHVTTGTMSHVSPCRGKLKLERFQPHGALHHHTTRHRRCAFRTDESAQSSRPICLAPSVGRIKTGATRRKLFWSLVTRRHASRGPTSPAASSVALDIYATVRLWPTYGSVQRLAALCPERIYHEGPVKLLQNAIG